MSPMGILYIKDAHFVQEMPLSEPPINVSYLLAALADYRTMSAEACHLSDSNNVYGAVREE